MLLSYLEYHVLCPSISPTIHSETDLIRVLRSSLKTGVSGQTRLRTRSFHWVYSMYERLTSSHFHPSELATNSCYGPPLVRRPPPAPSTGNNFPLDLGPRLKAVRLSPLCL